MKDRIKTWWSGLVDYWLIDNPDVVLLIVAILAVLVAWSVVYFINPK